MINQEQVLKIIQKMITEIREQKDFLSDLDNVIGDGDHGINMARGFDEIERKVPALEGKDIGAILKTVGMTLVSTVGGASGPLYGTAFMKAGGVLTGKSQMDIHDFCDALKSAIDGVMMRGKSTTGEKTMLDAMVPAYKAITGALEESNDAIKALKAGVAAAKEGVEYTKTIIATKGRASYLGERSIGHQDPGATSFTILLEAITTMI
ncbi:MAG: dihydroxyacetone kinase subunit L [Clostridiaceae bacterium]|mgnify:CR=1 FL=1|nr:dihydroxyacetone kinase subunit L [Clostridiaceae bacterium]